VPMQPVHSGRPALHRAGCAAPWYHVADSARDSGILAVLGSLRESRQTEHTVERSMGREMAGKRALKVGLLGLGVVGSGVAEILCRKADTLEREIGRRVEIARVLVRDPIKPRRLESLRPLLTTDPAAVLDDPEIDIVIELMGGEEPARSYICRAIKNRKHLVTANKEVMAKHGLAVLQLAQEHGVDVYYEASVGGGIPLIGTFRQDLAANEVREILAIINGTTNFILSKMAQEGWTFEDALHAAQQLGYAEADPTNDIEGIDAAYKLAILASIAFRQQIRPEQIYREGITRLHPSDFRYAHELGYAIKLLAIARASDGEVEVRVHPTLVPQHWLLAQVNGVFNAVQLDGDLVGKVLFYGQGAGAYPTASAVVADVIDIVHNINSGVANRVPFLVNGRRRLRPIGEVASRHYFRFWVADRPGVLAKIAHIFGENNISIASVLQKESDETAQFTELVIMTHVSREAWVQRALEQIRTLDVVREVAACLRVEIGER
jgi:homoserine dehydrogenase